MDCPVCQYKGIPESTKKCPNCHSDLTGFRQLYQLRDTLKQKRNIIFAMGALLVILMAVLGYMFLFSNSLPSRFSNMALQEKENEIVKLKKQNSRLQKQILDLQQQLNMKNMADTGQTGQDEEQFQKVIPSPSEQEKQAASPASPSAKRQTQEKKPAQQRKTTTKTEEKEGPQNVTYYRVKAGETLYSIAKRMYGDGKKYKKIMEDNNIEDPSDVQVGMKLKIIR
ncbi:MAG: LysM peptidoglycan-binding domain-containing protein [Bacteroidales bacterium]|nr:LysM peptidoglycan-binding domain-containing protein [Bacteroidales bacterium]MCF8334606.1 LysM peptidoglycan-binding domain-containing protein [Bacteroidales bacterium]